LPSDTGILTPAPRRVYPDEHGQVRVVPKPALSTSASTKFRFCFSAIEPRQLARRG
jgi:P pilus assembly chaperone PapD